MFNLSAANNSGYNGISQLSEAQTDFSDRLVNSKAKLQNYMHSHLVPQLKQSKEDVYTFHDSDQTFANAKLPEFEGSKKNLNNLITSRRIQIVKPLNGLGAHRDANQLDLHNGENKRNAIKGPPSKPSICNKITVKQSKDLVAPIPSDFKIASDNGLNNPTKNSITNSNINSIITKCGPVYLNRKSGEGKQDSAVKKVETNLVSNYLNDVAIKSTARKIPSGKPLPAAFKSKKGRGPTVHEALQRITPFPTNNTSKGTTTTKWHSPASDLFDCGAIDSYPYVTEIDSDSSDDSLYDYVNNSWFDCNSKSEDRSKRISNSTAMLRRRITEIQRLESMIHMPKSSSELYFAIKNQMKQQRSNSFNDFRLEGPALELLLNSRSSDNILSSSDKRKIRNGKRPIESINCAHPGCKAPSLACARLCLAHISLNPEQKLFLECIAKSSNNVQCKAPVANVRNEQPLCPKHIWKKENPSKTIADKQLSSRKRHKPSAVIRPQNRDLSNEMHHHNETDFINFEKKVNLNGMPNNKNVTQPLFSPNSVMVNGRMATSYLDEDNTDLNVCSNSSYTSSEDAGIDNLTESELIHTNNHPQQIVDADVVADVLAMHELPLELPPPEPPQEPNIDLSTVFNDFFTGHNGEYIPTREETEELERALEAVNQDVKSLEKLTASQHSSLLDSLLDEKVLAETLASLPDVFNSIPPVKMPSETIVQPSSSNS